MSEQPTKEDYFAALDAPLIPYYVALGKFLSAYALVEAQAFYILRECSGVTPEVARALFSGTRAKAALDYLKRISEVENWADGKKAPLDAITSQFGDVTRVRNDILHYGASSTGTDGEWTTTNAGVVHIEKQIRATRITPAILDDLTHDCYKIAAHLNLVGEEPDPNPRSHTRHTLGPLLDAAWRYKSELPIFPPEIPPASRREGRGQPRPSQE